MTPIYLNEQAILPGKIVCIGRNYVDHIHELGNELPDDMVVFIKPGSAVSEHLLAYHQEPLHYETELCLLLENGLPVAAGIGMDLTKRALQTHLKQKGLPWERAKAFDGAVTFSPFVEVPTDLSRLRFTLHVDDSLTQYGDPSLMLYPPQQITANLQQFMTLNDNDILMTGTPKGVGQIQAGCRYRVTLFDNDNVLLEHEWQGITA